MQKMKLLAVMIPAAALSAGCPLTTRIVVPVSDNTVPDFAVTITSPHVSLADAYGLPPEEVSGMRTDMTAEFEGIGIDQVIQFLVVASDEESGIAYVQASLVVPYSCGTWGTAEAREYGDFEDDRPALVPGPGDEINISRAVGVGFRLRDISDLCTSPGVEPRLGTQFVPAVVKVFARNGTGGETGFHEYPFDLPYSGGCRFSFPNDTQACPP